MQLTQTAKVNCLNRVTTPCNDRSVPVFLSCVEDLCASTPANMTLMLDPKKEYSCQDSLLPESSQTLHALALSSDGQCVDSPYNFKSFIIGSNPGDHNQSSLAVSGCRMELYPDTSCCGDRFVVDASDIKQGCTFLGGRSARLDCSIEHIGQGELPQPALTLTVTDVYAAAYRSLAGLCAQEAFPRDNNSSAPQPSVKLNGTATATGVQTTSASASASSSPIVPATPGAASTEKNVQRSLVALLAVIVAAVVLL